MTSSVRPRLSWRLGTVASAAPETPRATTLAFDVPDWAGHRAGQHVDIRLTAEDGYQTERSYSIASVPAPHRIEITVERLDDGEVSPYLTDGLTPGDQVELRGPIGGWFTWEASDGGPLLLVAGGSGMAPLMSMLRHRHAVDSAVPTRLLYSARSADEILYRPELERLAADDDHLEITYTLTRTRPAGWSGYGRRIDREIIEAVGWAAADRPLAFVCGPTQLVESVATGLVGLGYDPGRVKTERFGPSGR